MSAPAAPTIKTQPFARDQSLSFTWTADPVNVDNYYIYDNDGISTLLTSVPGTINLTTVTGLTNGQTYNAFISGSNGNGMGEPSFFRPFQPGLPPTVAPTTATATKVGDSNALIEWTPSGESLVAPIQWYVIRAVSSDPAASNFRYTADGVKPETTYLATGFNAYSYTFTVQGVNCPGYSPAAITNSINFGAVGGAFEFTAAAAGFLSPAGDLPYAIGQNAYTWECFFYITSFASGTDFQFTLGDYPGSGTFFFLDVSNIDIQIEGISFGAPPGFTTGTWYHIAVARNSAGAGNDVAVWIDGTRLGSSQTDGQSYADAVFVCRTKTGVNGLNGYVTNINVNNKAIYNPLSASIVVPTAPITPDGDTLALYLATDAGTFLDDSGPNGYTLDTPINVTWANQSPF
jgi:hypothetical protein